MLQINQRHQLTVTEIYPRQAIYGFQLAPDDRHIVFVQQRDQQVGPVENDGQKQFKITPLADLCLLPSDGGYPRALTTLGDLKHPATWSPDGKWLAFERRGLCVMPVTGGEMRVLYKGALYRPPLAMGDASRGLPGWSPDGDWLLFATRDAPRAALRLVSFDGRTQQQKARESTAYFGKNPTLFFDSICSRGTCVTIRAPVKCSISFYIVINKYLDAT
jgi:Tol biopolymer transport system component